MICLHKKYWEKSFKEADKFNGNKFEDLVEILLKEHFDGNWIATQKTWDGGKDFVKQDKIHKSWAECKIYNNNITISTLGKTLVMVVVENDVNNLFIFSYSPIVKTATQQLAAFARNAHVNIMVYDDVKLEELILKSDKSLKTFFQTFNKDACIQLPVQPDEFLINISTDLHVNFSEVETDNKTLTRHPTLLYDQTFAFELLIINNELKDKQYQLDLKEFTKTLELILLSMMEDKVNVYLRGCEIKSIRFFLKARSYNNIQIPAIPIHYDNQIFKTESITIDMNLMPYPVLVGSQFIDEKESFESSISTNNGLRVFTISGSSGVGKSRMGSEFVDILLKQNYDVYSYESSYTEHYQVKKLIQKLLSYLYKIPIIQNNDPSNQEFASLSTLIGGNYSLNDELLERAIKHIASGIKKYRFALLIDNIQALESDAIRLLDQLIYKLYDSHIQVVIVTLFNNDYLSMNETASLFRQKLHTDKRTKEILIKDFLPFEVKIFLNNQIKIQNDDTTFCSKYPETSDLIIQKVGTNIFNLFQTILHLYSSKAITFEKNYFFINDLGLFHEIINSLAPEIEKILQQRYDLLNSHYPKSTKALKFFALFGEIHRMDLDELYPKTLFEKEDFERLINLGFLKELNGTIVFYHNMIQKFMYKLNFWEDTEIIIEIANKYDEQYIDYTVGFYTALLLTNTYENVIHDITDYIKQHSFAPNNQTRLFAEQMHKVLKKTISSRQLSYSDELICLNKLMPILLYNIPIDKRVKILENEYRARYKKYGEYVKEPRLFSLLLREYASWTCQIEKPIDGYNAIKEFLQTLDTYENKENVLSFQKIRADLINRQCVCKKFQGDFEAAEKKGVESLEISKQHGFKTEECLNLIDMGYIYYGCGKDTEKLIHYWQLAVNVFDQNEKIICQDNKDMKYAGYLIKCSLEVLSYQQNASHNISDLISLCKREYSSYYLKQAILLDIILRFMKKELKNISFKIDNLEDLSAATNETKFYIKALHARAKHYIFLKRYEDAKEYLDKAIENLKISNKNYFEKEACLVKDYIRVILFLGKEGSDRKLGEILSSSQKDINILLDEKLTTSFNIDGENLPLP